MLETGYSHYIFQQFLFQIVEPITEDVMHTKNAEVWFWLMQASLDACVRKDIIANMCGIHAEVSSVETRKRYYSSDNLL